MSRNTRIKVTSRQDSLIAFRLWLFSTYLEDQFNWMCPADDLKSVFLTIHLELNALPVSSTWYDLKFLKDKEININKNIYK